MPAYDYRCSVCHSQFESRHKLTAAAPPCPQCGGSAVRVILSAPAIHGFMARGRDRAARSIPECGKGCRCCP